MNFLFKIFLVGGTTGEHMSLSVGDRKNVIDAWVKVAKTTSLHIQVQVGGAPLADVLDLVSDIMITFTDVRYAHYVESLVSFLNYVDDFIAIVSVRAKRVLLYDYEIK